MLKYAIRKTLMTLPLLVGVVTLIFVMLEIAPGSVVDRFISQDTTPEVEEALRAKWHLDQPAVIRYVYLMKNLMVMDFGMSMSKQDQPVIELIGQTLPNTMILGFVTLLFLFPTGIILGTFQAVRQNRVEDTGISVVSLFFYSMPGFWLAMMLQLTLAYYLSEVLGFDLFPLDGMQDTMSFTYPKWSLFGSAGEDGMWGTSDDIPFNPIAGKRTLDILWHLILPGAALGIAFSAGTARYMRSSLLEVIRLDYIRTARAKGLSEFAVTFKHAMRNALLPIVTLLGLSLRSLVGGSVLIEYIFSWPGMGRLTVEAIFAQDAPLIIGCCFILTLVTVIGNLLADLLYAVVDPRIRYT